MNALDLIRRWRAELASFAFGAVASLAMPPTHLWWLFLVAVPVFIWRLEHLDGSRQGLWHGWLFGFGYFCAALHWIAFAFFIDAASFLWMMPFAVGGLAAVMALYWAAAAGTVVALRRHGMPPWLTFPALLSVAEWLRGHLMTGFPWDAPGLAFDGMGSFLQLASLVGMPGLTLIILLWSSALRGLMVKAAPAQRAIAAVLILTVAPCWLWSSNRDQHTVPFVEGVQLAVVQPNIPQDDKWRSDNASRVFDDLVAASQAVPQATHIIWPESAIPFLLDESDAARAVLRTMLAPGRVLITGAIRRSSTDLDAAYFTSIQVYDDAARLVGVYDKWRLVPGGEFLPFAFLLEPLGFKRLVNLPDGFSAGAGPRSLAIPGAGLAAALICYEAIFPDRLIAPQPRPQWIVNVTNDGWFGASTGPYQHFALVRMRAVEQGLPAVRSANTGISGVIDPFGHVLAATGLNIATTVSSGLPKPALVTPYGEWGDWIVAGLVTALLLLSTAFACKLRCFVAISRSF